MVMVDPSSRRLARTALRMVQALNDMMMPALATLTTGGCSDERLFQTAAMLLLRSDALNDGLCRGQA